MVILTGLMNGEVFDPVSASKRSKQAIGLPIVLNLLLTAEFHDMMLIDYGISIIVG